MQQEKMQTSDLLTRIAGGIMIVAAVWNCIVAVLYFVSLVWVCVGVWWLVPLLLSLVQIGLGIGTIIKGHHMRPLAFAPFFGLLVSICNLNFCALFIDVIAIGLGLGGWFTYEEPTEFAPGA